jgi:hypothetical protein
MVRIVRAATAAPWRGRATAGAGDPPFTTPSPSMPQKGLHMRSSTRVVSVAVAATLLVAACGTDGSGTGSGDGTLPGTVATTTATTPDTTAETTPDTTATSEPDLPAQDLEADTAAAEAALLTAADLPEGWTEESRDGDAAATLDGRLAECVGADGITAADATASSARLVAPEGNLVVTEDIGARAGEREARLFVALFAEPGVPACLEAAYGEFAADVLGATVADGAQFGTPAAARLAVGSAGDATQAIRVVVPVTGDPSVSTVTVDHVVVRAGRALASLTFENRTEATPVETIDEFTALAAERLTS